MNIKKRKKLEKIQDEINPDKTGQRNVKRIINRFDSVFDYFDNLIKAIKENKPNLPTEIKVKAELPDKLEIKNFPKSIKIDRPDWHKDPPKIQEVKVVNEQTEPKWLQGKIDSALAAIASTMAQVAAGIIKGIKNTVLTVRVVEQPQDVKGVVLLDPKTKKPFPLHFLGGSGLVTSAGGGGSAVIEQQILDQLKALNSLVPSRFDYIEMSYPDGVTEVFVYKVGGASGSTVSMITVVYTNASKDYLSTVTRS